MSLFSSNEEHFCTPFALHNKSNSRRGQIEKSRLEPENEYGNIEYKLRLVDPSPDRVERLVTQLKWRIREGQGEAILYLGVQDDGLFVGLTSDEIRMSLQTLEQMSAKIGAKMTVVNERIVENESDDTRELTLGEQTCPKGKIIRNRTAYSRHKENLVCKKAQSLTSERDGESRGNGNEPSIKKPINKSFSAGNRRPSVIRKVIQVLVERRTHDISEEIRVAVLGPTESGKSSLLGVLSHGENDNGRGSARLNLFRHRHEVRSGHTSSISQEVFGFTGHGQPLTYSTCLSTEEMIESSSKIVTLIDLAGHHRYMSTTLFGLGSHCPDIVLLVVSARSSVISFTDHILLALGMEKSFAIVINKIDMVSQQDHDIVFNDIVNALHSSYPEVVFMKIQGVHDAASAGSLISEKDSGRTVPVFFTSCITGAGLDSLYAFFNRMSPGLDQADLYCAVSKASELQIDETFQVPGIGTVLSGLMVEGVIREGDELLIGPDDRGNFHPASIVSLQRHKVPCNFVRAGQKCTMAIKANNVKVRRGMVMKEMDHDWSKNFPVCLQFEAAVKFLTKATFKLGQGSQVSVYVGNVRQTCRILSLKPASAASCDNWSIELAFTKRPEYIREGSRLIIRDAQTKGTGIVRRVSFIGRHLE